MTEIVCDYHTLIYRAKENKIKGYSNMTKNELVKYLNSKGVCTTKTCPKKRQRKEGTPNTAYQNFISKELKGNTQNIPQQEKMKQAAANWKKQKANTSNGTD